jgi:hypothetical protein
MINAILSFINCVTVTIITTMTKNAEITDFIHSTAVIIAIIVDVTGCNEVYTSIVYSIYGR